MVPKSVRLAAPRNISLFQRTVSERIGTPMETFLSLDLRISINMLIKLTSNCSTHDWYRMPSVGVCWPCIAKVKTTFTCIVRKRKLNRKTMFTVLSRRGKSRWNRKLKRTHHRSPSKQLDPPQPRTHSRTLSFLSARYYSNDRERRVSEYATSNQEHRFSTPPSRNLSVSTTPIFRRSLKNCPTYSTQSTSESEANQVDLPMIASILCVCRWWYISSDCYWKQWTSISNDDIDFLSNVGFFLFLFFLSLIKKKVPVKFLFSNVWFIDWEAVNWHERKIVNDVTDRKRREEQRRITLASFLDILRDQTTPTNLCHDSRIF